MAAAVLGGVGAEDLGHLPDGRDLSLADSDAVLGGAYAAVTASASGTPRKARAPPPETVRKLRRSIFPLLARARIESTVSA
ncbi:hypothetical protein ACIQNG_33680 [Streptomyces sp. NPDC091377]|uniref:hypothetical protein n=1 Tax=Streptomyces sp. NPDC091377 TaxID=3365995 RepID=UPI0037F6C303